MRKRSAWIGRRLPVNSGSTHERRRCGGALHRAAPHPLFLSQPLPTAKVSVPEECCWPTTESGWDAELFRRSGSAGSDVLGIRGSLNDAYSAQLESVRLWQKAGSVHSENFKARGAVLRIAGLWNRRWRDEIHRSRTDDYVPSAF